MPPQDPKPSRTDGPSPLDDPEALVPDVHPDHAFQLLLLHASNRAAWEKWRKSGDVIPPARTGELSAERAAKLAPRKPAKKKTRE